MASLTGLKGIDVRQTGNELVFRAFLQTSAGALLTTGTVVFYLTTVQSDGTILTYDFASSGSTPNQFTAATVTTETLAATYRKSNNGATDTGLWTAVLSTLTGFTVGQICQVRVNCSGASPTDQMREFQYGSAEGDGVVTQGATGVAYLQTDTHYWLGTVASTPATAGIPDVNAKNINNVATTSVTTISAFIGSTVALTFDANNYVKADVVDILGTASAGTAGYVGIDWSAVHAPTSAVGLSGTTVGTVTTVTNQLTAAAVATGVWQDATAGDFTAASSIGKSLYTTGNAPGTTSGIALVSSLPGAAPTAAAVATAVWQDSTAGDFTAAGSIGKSLAPSPLGTVPGASGGIQIAGSNAATTWASGSHLIGTVDTVTTTTAATNLTNAPTAGDFTAAMKTSLGTAVGTAQTGDSYAYLGTNLGALGANATSIASAANLSTLQTSVNNLNNLSALANLFGPSALEIPASGSIAYPFTVTIKDSEGHLLDLSGSPTLTAHNAAGTDRSANLSAVTHASTGIYTFSYTVLSSAAQEGLTFSASGTASSDSTARAAYASAAVVAVDTTTAIAAIKAQTDKLVFDGSNYIKSDPQTLANTGVAFPSTVASPTNITAGTITTVTSVTNAPTAGDFTAAMKSSLNASTPTSIQTVTNIVSSGAITTSGGKVSEVALVDTLTTYSGNTPQTGDSYAIVNSGSFGNSALATLIGGVVGSVFSETIETGLTFLQAQKLILAASVGVVANAASSPVTIAAAGNAGTNRISAVVDADGNRSSVTLNV